MSAIGKIILEAGEAEGSTHTTHILILLRWKILNINDERKDKRETTIKLYPDLGLRGCYNFG